MKTLRLLLALGLTFEHAKVFIPILLKCVMRQWILVVAIVAVLIVSGCANQKKLETDNSQFQPADGVNMGNRHVLFETSMGNFKAELFEDKAPLTSGNFIKLIEKGFYNGVIFHRVIPDFMIQGGDPTGTGMGGPGYTIKDEFGPGLKHNVSGLLSMANSGPNTGGSQFFITVAPTPWLDGKHAIFGRIVEGYDVVEKISKVQRDSDDKPLTTVTMKKVSIVGK